MNRPTRKLVEDALRTPESERAIRRMKKSAPPLARAIPVSVWLLIIRVALGFIERLLEEAPKVASKLKAGQAPTAVLSYLDREPGPGEVPYDDDQRDAIGALWDAVDGNTAAYDAAKANGPFPFFPPGLVPDDGEDEAAEEAAPAVEAAEDASEEAAPAAEADQP